MPLVFFFIMVAHSANKCVKKKRVALFFSFGGWKLTQRKKEGTFGHRESRSANCYVGHELMNIIGVLSSKIQMSKKLQISLLYIRIFNLFSKRKNYMKCQNVNLNRAVHCAGMQSTDILLTIMCNNSAILLWRF